MNTLIKYLLQSLLAVAMGIITPVVLAGSISAQVMPAKVLMLDPGVSGKVKSISVEVGQSVLPGTLLLELDTILLDSQLSSATTQTAFRKSEMEEASRSFERDSALFDDGSLSAVELDQRKIALQHATAVYKQSIAEQVGIESAIDASKIFAPVAGMLIQRNVEPGQRINLDYLHVPSLVFISSEQIIQAQIPPDQVLGLKPGAKVDIIHSTGTSGGSVMFIDPVTNMGQILVSIRAENQLPPIGHPVEVNF